MSAAPTHSELSHQRFKRLRSLTHNRVRFTAPGRLLQRLGLILIALVFVLTSSSYAIALWYQHSQAGIPYQLGTTFIPEYATSLGLDPHAVLQSALDDLGVRQFRLVSYWDQVEPSPGKFDFSQLDWQFAAIEKAGGTISLSMGLRQPRWPECHAPKWIDTTKQDGKWQRELLHAMAATVHHFKDSSALRSYQLENEYFNNFGDCHDFSRTRLSNELLFLKLADPSHPVIISRSNNYAGLPLRAPVPDVHGISLYRHVYSPWVHGYWQYPFPSWYYAFLAGAQKLTSGKPSVIHELQAEPWPPRGQTIIETPLAEQNKTFDAQKFAQTVVFAKQTGIRNIDLWGLEYWYYRAKVLHDPSVWQEAQKVFKQQ